MRHFESIVETNVGTGESAAALQTSLGYQKFFHDMGSMLLDIASLTSFKKDLLEKPLSEQGPGEMLQALDGHLEAVQDFESLTGTVGGAVGVTTTAQISDMAEQFGVEEHINEANRQLHNAASIHKDTHAKGKEGSKETTTHA